MAIKSKFKNISSLFLNNIKRPKILNPSQKTIQDTETKSWKDIPGPFSLPLIGCLLHFTPKLGALESLLGFELADYLYYTYGPIVKIEGFLTTPNLIFLYDPDGISQVLRGEDLLPIRPGFQSVEYYRKIYRKKMHPGIETSYRGTTGLVTEHGEAWKEFRSIVNPILLKPQTIKLYKTSINDVAIDMVQRIKALRDINNTVPNDFDIEMNKWALEAVGMIALGKRIGCLNANIPEDSPARQLIKIVHEIHNIGQLLDFKPSLWRYYPTRLFKKAMHIYDKQMELNSYFIKEAIKEIEFKKQTGGNEESRKGVLEKLLDIDENVAIIMASDLLFAGVDTASSSMLAMLYLLATNPVKQEKLRQEIMSGDELKPYLRACIKESIRVMPVVSGNVRLTTKEYNICGYIVPKDTTVVFGHQYVAAMENQYPKAREYIPERWLVGKDHPLFYGNAHKFAYTPFGYGVRQCVGKRIAYLEFETLLTNILQNFRIEWKGPKPEIRSTSLNYFYGPFCYIFHDLK